MICQKRGILNHNEKKKERFRENLVKSLIVKDSLADSKSKRNKISLGGRNSVPIRTKNLSQEKFQQILRDHKADLDQGLLEDKLKLTSI